MDDWKDRFYDEYDYVEPLADATCGTCGRFLQCELEGHEEVGYCGRYDEFYLASDEADECWEE